MTGHSFRQNPYVGIRPFFDEDSIFFFGRREQTKELLAGLGKSRFLTVLGSSGSGKSSLVRSGLIPTLQAGFLVGARTKWRMAKCRPGDAPLENLADALLRAAGKERTNDAVHACADALREGHLDAALNLLQPVVQADENVLVLMDQFEELFAFRSGASGESVDEAATRDSNRVAERIRRRSDAASVVSLLLDLSAQSRVPVYIVLTMRTDFLGDTDVFPGLPEAINRSGYLVPRLTRSQLREAIEGPAQLLGARVEPRLVDRLVNDVGDRGDRLPLLQHALHRAWDAWDDEGRIGPIDTRHLERIGGLDHALDQEGEEVISGTPVAVAERVFKRLTDTDPQKRRVRRPARRSELLAIAGADAAVVDALLVRCAAEGTNFVFASPDGQPDDPRYSIAHESLIRQWDRLRRWVDDEQALRDWYLGIAREVAAWRADRSLPLLSAQATRVAREMWRQHAPSAEWAARYPEAASSHREISAFINESYEHNERQRRQRVTLLSSLAAVLVIAAALVAWSGVRARRALAHAETLGFTAAIEQFATEDPTYAAALAAEFDTTSTWDGKRFGLVHRVLGQPHAVAEFRGVSTIALSPDGSKVVLVRDRGRVEVRAADGSGDALMQFRAPWVTAALLDSAGQVWTLSDQPGELLRWSGPRGSKERIRLPTREPIVFIEMHESGRRVVAVSYSVAVFAAHTQDARFREVRKPSDLNAFLWLHPERDELAFLGQGDGEVFLLNLDTGAELARLTPSNGNRSTPERISSSRDGKKVLVGHLLSTQPDLFTLNPSLTTVERRDTWQGAGLRSASLSPDGSVLAVGYPSGRVELHRGVSRDTIWRRETPEEWPNAEFTRDGRWIVVTSPYGTIRLISRDDPEVELSLPGHRAALQPAVLSTTGRTFITRSEDSVARVWAPWNRPDLRGLPGIWPRGTDVLLSEDASTLFASFRSGLVEAYPLDSADAGAFRQQLQLIPDTAAPELLAVAPSGNHAMLRTRRDGIVIWQVGVGQRRVPSLPESIDGAMFLPDGSGVLVESGDTLLTVHDFDAPRPRPFSFRGSYVKNASVSNDGRSVFYATGTALVRGDLRSGEIDTLREWGQNVTDEPRIQTSPDGRYALFGWQGGPRVLHDAAQPDSASVFDSDAETAVFSPNGRLLATAPPGLAVEIWRLPIRTKPAPPRLIKGFRRLIASMSFSAAGDRLITTTEAGEVQVWSMGDTIRQRLSLVHSPRPAYSEFRVFGQSSFSRGDGEIRSIVQAPQTIPRVRLWSLAPSTIHRQLRAATNVCVPFGVRRRVLGSELEDVARERVERCEARARTSAPLLH